MELYTILVQHSRSAIRVTYAEGKVKRQAEGAKVGRCEGHTFCREKMLHIRHGTHHGRERGEEEDRAKSPSIPSTSAQVPVRIRHRGEVESVATRLPEAICEIISHKGRVAAGSAVRLTRVGSWDCQGGWPRSETGPPRHRVTTATKRRAISGKPWRGVWEATYRMTNFLGRSERTGNRAKQMTKQARAARLQAPKTSIRSHRLTRKTVC